MKFISGIKNVLIGLGFALGAFIVIFVIAGSFFYYTQCPFGIDRTGLPYAEWQPKLIPFVWQAPEGCLSDHAVRVFLGEVGVMDDATPRVPRLPG